MEARSTAAGVHVCSYCYFEGGMRHFNKLELKWEIKEETEEMYLCMKHVIVIMITMSWVLCVCMRVYLVL